MPEHGGGCRRRRHKRSYNSTWIGVSFLKKYLNAFLYYFNCIFCLMIAGMHVVTYPIFVGIIIAMVATVMCADPDTQACPSQGEAEGEAIRLNSRRNAILPSKKITLALQINVFGEI